ncbi:Protein RarD [Vibrio stylophorae]|uniref:Protein RarD n=1 Tax=Vibrio stylophorae TaxID=659351 RepID=A0ABM8ZWT3_9VIBR|nr:EamA family transporter RarD [Vibrio stylophorae]CAH0535094.1 Protein RarD [Vibrio stylophorae]
MATTRAGNLLAAFSFVLWGLLPVYYQFLPAPDMPELLALRILCSVPTMLLVFWLLRRPMPNWRQVFKNKRSVAISGIAALIMSVSWCAFTWAIANGQVLAASLGFFINPLFAIALAVFILKERLSYAQGIAVCLGILGIAYQVWHYGELPWLALIMGSFFALYGLCKKYVEFDAMTSVTLENILLAPFALLFLIGDAIWGTPVALGGDSTTLLLYIGAAPVTLVPLIFFALALHRTSLTMVGLMQYIEPSLQFILAVLFFGEIFDNVKAVSFALIWGGLLFCSLEAIYALRKHRHHRNSGGNLPQV